MKNRIENGSRAVNLGVNPHSNEELIFIFCHCMFLYIYRLCPGSGFVSLHADPTFIKRIRIRIIAENRFHYTKRSHLESVR